MASSSFDKLPPDLLRAVLQLLPAKELCRLRAVCRSWRTHTSDAAFIKAHTKHHKETLLLAKFRHDETNIYVVDLSGNVVKKIARADRDHQVQRTRLDLACLATPWNTCRLLNPATGRVRVLPLIPAVHKHHGIMLRDHCTFFALGSVGSTSSKEYKLLRCWCPPSFKDTGHRVHVFTINGGTGGWRPRPGPRCSFDMDSGVVVDGVVYFFKLPAYYRLVYGGSNLRPVDDIVSFDLAGEEWRRELRGPLSTSNVPSAELVQSQLTLCDLKGSLVLAHPCGHRSTLDLWFLLDFESGQWVKEYSIRTESVTSGRAIINQIIIPLLVLHDGRLVIYIAMTGLLFICDPGTNTFTRVDMRDRLGSVGMYTGSLLSLEAVAMV